MFQLISVKNLPIIKQLQLEEALLRADTQNWCLINEGSPEAIVLGISGKVDELIHLQKAKQSSIPLIRRFSGGGTVVVDANTLFITFILNANSPSIDPKKIMAWTEEIYQPFFSPLPFKLKENDYTIENFKCGGNAQYIQRGRWLHHTSFLWDYCPKRMNLLKIPPRQPEYRRQREHHTFLRPLRHYFETKEDFIQKLRAHLTQKLSAIPVSIEDALKISTLPHRKATQIL